MEEGVILNKEKAIDNLSIIQGILRKKESNPFAMSNLLMIIGLSNVAYLVISMLSIRFMGSLSNWWLVTLIAESLIYIFLLYAIFKVIRIERKDENNYYIFTLYFILLTTVLMPFIMLVTRLIGSRFSDFSTLNQMIYEMSKMNSFLQISIFSGMLFILGSFRKNNWFIFLSLLNIFAYLLFSFKTIDFSNMEIFIHLGQVYYTAVITLGYIVIGSLLKKIGKHTNE